MSINDFYTTPSESFTNTSLTPPPTNEKKSLSVVRIIQAIKNLNAGRGQENYLSEYILEPEDYGILLRSLQNDNDKSLWGFVEDKLRYEEYISLPHWNYTNLNFDSLDIITSPQLASSYL